MSLYDAFIIGVGFSIGTSLINGTKLMLLLAMASFTKKGN